MADPGGGRVFLTRAELDVFRRWGVPVRYIRGWRAYLGETCAFCGRAAETAAHKIPYRKGILEYHLTPTFLNRRRNLVATCRSCNKKAEWPEARIRGYVERLRAKHGPSTKG